MGCVAQAMIFDLRVGVLHPSFRLSNVEADGIAAASVSRHIALTPFWSLLIFVVWSWPTILEIQFGN